MSDTLRENRINYALPHPNYEVKGDGEFEKILRGEKLQRLVGTIMHRAGINRPLLLIADKMVQASGQHHQGLMLHAPQNGGICFRWQDGSNKARIQFIIRTPSAVVRNSHEFHSKVEGAFRTLLSQPDVVPSEDDNRMSGTEAKPNGGSMPTQSADAMKSAQTSVAPKTQTGQSMQAAASLSERVKAYRTQHNLSVQGFADRCYFSTATIYKIEKGEPATDRVAESVEAVLAGRAVPKTRSTEQFDSSCEQMISIVVDTATKNNSLDELVRLVFTRLTQAQTPEDGKMLADQLLRRYLAAEDEGSRATALLEIRDFLKPVPKSGVR